MSNKDLYTNMYINQDNPVGNNVIYFESDLVYGNSKRDKRIISCILNFNILFNTPT